MPRLIGKVLCYLYLSPERLAHEGIFTLQDLHEELMSLADESKLLKLVNQRSTGSDLDKQKLYDKVKTSLNRLRRLGMVFFIVCTTAVNFVSTKPFFVLVPMFVVVMICKKRNYALFAMVKR